MKIFITGGTGFIGSHLVRGLLAAGHEPLVLSRSPEGARRLLPPGIQVVEGNPAIRGPWVERVGEAEAIVNLVGEPILGRWTASKKEALLASRVTATRTLVAAIPPERAPAMTLVSGSAVGYYGFHGPEPLDETSPPGKDFLARLAVEWEAEARRAEARGTRVVLLRSGIVLGDGGALAQMARPFRLFGGGPLGSGQQYLSWVHMEDEVGLIMFALATPSLSGPLNATAPAPATNTDFARALGEVLGRPSWVHVPAFSVRLALGEFADSVLEGQRVLPARALAAGYRFRYPELGPALAAILTPNPLP